MIEHQNDIPGHEDTTEEAISPAPSPGSSSDPLIGTKIGSCTLKRIIGSGGMGTVYEAMQEQPRRRVALKMMKRGITSRSATRRFEFESQTLARLQHPGVAQVYEAGTHDDGSGGVPYFVMEYVANAMPLTEYANDKKLDTKERLDLFAKVCDAVQHGHLKGIVHRDLKPGNILVNSSGQPKVIDFGVARSTDSDMAVTTLQTDVGQLIGTLQYMSPEQCNADPSDIDARSDVYALGVVLYELLVDKLPYELKQIAIHEAVRIVREATPEKLSTINRQLRGDIEVISLKALDKDRNHRYQSAGALCEDINRYLTGSAITAKPVNFFSWLKRWPRRNPMGFAVAQAFLILILFFTLLTGNFAYKSWRNANKYAKARDAAITQRDLARKNEDKAKEQELLAVEAKDEAVMARDESEAVKDFLTSMLTSVDPATSWSVSARESAYQPALPIQSSTNRELMMLSLAAESVGEQFEDQPLVEAEIRNVIGSTYMALGKYDEAEAQFGEALEIRRRVLGDEHLLTLNSIGNMGNLLYNQGMYDEAEAYYLQELEGKRRVLGDSHIYTLYAIAKMGSMLKHQGKYHEAGVYILQALEGHRRNLGDEHPDTLTIIAKMAGLLAAQGKYDEAEMYYLQALEDQGRVLGDLHPSTLNSVCNMGNMLVNQGKYDGAEVYLLQALEGHRRILGDEHPHTLWSIDSLVELYDAWDNPEEAKKYRDMLAEEDTPTEDSE